MGKVSTKMELLSARDTPGPQYESISTFFDVNTYYLPDAAVLARDTSL